jgi:hypothetical protein
MLLFVWLFMSPFQGLICVKLRSQGVALGTIMPPLWGSNQALKGRNTVAQGNALGKRPPNNSALKGRHERVKLFQAIVMHPAMIRPISECLAGYFRGAA